MRLDAPKKGCPPGEETVQSQSFIGAMWHAHAKGDSVTELKRTPLYEKHIAHGARMVPFSGWEMPVQYSGIIDEHEAVRSRAGLFDVSHMGEFEFRGPQLKEFLNYLSANDATRLTPGRAQYSMLLNEQGGTIDDIIIYLLEDDHALMVVNSSNIDKDWEHVARVASGFDVEAENRSDDFALFAVQGPRAVEVVNALTEDDVSALDYYAVARTTIDGHDVIVARTGYTGEDGFEIFVRPEEAPGLWDRVLEAGESHGLKPAGLGARDTLRLEASMPLYGQELDEDTSPLEAGLGYFVAKEGDYIGAARQRELREKGLPRRLVMLRLEGRGIARHGYDVQDQEGRVIGHVTSGSMSPHLSYPIAQAYVEAGHHDVGNTVYVDVRGRKVPAKVVKRPFYKRQEGG
jgi:aminomethyltransferase